jgi:hypothetical protein
VAFTRHACRNPRSGKLNTSGNYPSGEGDGDALGEGEASLLDPESASELELFLEPELFFEDDDLCVVLEWWRPEALPE